MMRNHPVLIMLALLFSSAQLVSQTVELDKGDKAFESFDFQEALFFYETAHESQPKDPAITRRIASTYRRMGQIPMAAQWYQKTLELDASNAEDMLRYAEILKNLQQYEESIQWYEMYGKLRPTDLRAQSHLRDKNYFKDLFADTARYKMKKLKLNNENPVLGITLFEDEKLLVSAIQLDQATAGQNDFMPYLDVYECELNGQDELDKPIRLGKNVNSDYHDGPAFYCFADKTLYITRNNMKGKKPKFNKNGNAILKIYEAQFENGKWSEATELKFNDDGFSSGHPCLSKDGQTMYFVSDRAGGLGGTDLYVCYKTAGGWSQPINLGSNVNTEGNEMFPFLGEDGFLYFSSDGHAGLGGMDIFHSDQVGGVWQQPLNLGAPINSHNDDFSIVYDKESDNGFFCSNRGGKGDDDMYFYKHISISNMIIAGTIKANKPNISLAGERIMITKLNSGEVTYQTLGEFENFEFSANAGDQIEIVMMNAEYFDAGSTVVSYGVASPILDPYINIGEKQAELTKAPAHDGQLSLYKDGGLADGHPVLKSGSPLGELGGLDKGASADVNDGSGLNLKEGTANKTATKNEATYKAKIAEGDKFIAAGKLTEAKKAYKAAEAVKPGESYPAQQLAVIAEKEKAANAAAFTTKVIAADKFYEQQKWSEAKAAYQAAGALSPSEPYIKERLELIDAAMAQAAERAYADKLLEADKLVEQEKWGEAKAAYQAAVIMKPAEAYPKNQMAVTDSKIKLAEEKKQQVKYDDEIEKADKLFSQRKWAEAKASYKAALVIKPGDTYAKKQVENVSQIISPSKKSVAAPVDAEAAKKPSEFDLAVPVIDLVALSLDNVIFEYNKTYIREEDKPRLDEVYKLMVANPKTKLLVRAHCDSRGSLAYNQSLSMSRAMAVQGYLMQKGIPRERFKSEWFGEQRPLNGCVDEVPCEEGEYEVNRRAEFKLVGL